MAKNPSVSLLSVQRLRSVLYALNVVVFFWLFIFWAHQVVFRVDLTQDKRHTLSPFTKATLQAMEDEVFVEVYLHGELPAAFRRLKKQLNERLEDLSAYKKDLRYQFIDPSLAASSRTQRDFFSHLAEKGVQPTHLFYTKNGAKVEKMIFPGALVHYRGRTHAVNLLESSKMASTEVIVNQAVEDIEYQFAVAWQRLSTEKKVRIGILLPETPRDSVAFQGLLHTLSPYYQVDVLAQDAWQADAYALIILVAPDEAFSARGRYTLDQHIMQGGRVLFFVEALRVAMHDLNQKEGFLPPTVPHDLGDMLFRYGVRVNADLVEDLRCAKYPVVVGKMGNQPNIQLLDWPFFPVLSGTNHLITRNMGGVLSQFASSLDTIQTPHVQKTPLLRTSPRTRVHGYPVSLSLERFREDFAPQHYEAGVQTVAYLLEGSFTSSYKNRILPAGVDEEGFVARGKRTKLIVVGDSDLVKSEIHPKTGEASPLGMYSPEQKKYANARFLLNAVSHLVDAEGLITTRDKTVQIRRLNKEKIAEQRQFLYLINAMVPLFLLILLAAIKHYARKRKYATS